MATKLDGLIGRELAGYLLTAKLGEGGMAVVFRGENVLDRSIVRAVKVVHPHLSSQEEFSRRFALEARVLERLQHPNVVRFFGLRQAQVDATTLLAMELELLDGEPLTNRIRTGIAVAEALEWVRQAAEGVAAAHALGVVHRDLKPDNLFLTRAGQVKVLDFGIARAADDARRTTNLTAADVIPGTTGYMAPEVCNGLPPSTSSDVYALGIVLYELLLGRHPFIEPGLHPPSGLQMMMAQVQKPMPAIRLSRPDVSDGLELVMESATQKDPRRRPQSASELAEALSLPTAPSIPLEMQSAPPPSNLTNFQLPSLRSNASPYASPYASSVLTTDSTSRARIELPAALFRKPSARAQALLFILFLMGVVVLIIAYNLPGILAPLNLSVMWTNTPDRCVFHPSQPITIWSAPSQNSPFQTVSTNPAITIQCIGDAYSQEYRSYFSRIPSGPGGWVYLDPTALARDENCARLPACR